MLGSDNTALPGWVTSLLFQEAPPQGPTPTHRAVGTCLPPLPLPPTQGPHGTPVPPERCCHPSSSPPPHLCGC